MQWICEPCIWRVIFAKEYKAKINSYELVLVFTLETVSLSLRPTVSPFSYAVITS